MAPCDFDEALRRRQLSMHVKHQLSIAQTRPCARTRRITTADLQLRVIFGLRVQLTNGELAQSHQIAWREARVN